MEPVQGILDSRVRDYSMESQPGLPKEIITALKEARNRGLPDGWTCVIDVSLSSLFETRRIDHVDALTTTQYREMDPITS